jgi:hypothetical protein
VPQHVGSHTRRGTICSAHRAGALAREQLEAARRATAGRAPQTVFGGHEHVVRQTVIALLRGRSLAEHVNPSEATVHVLRGRVRLATDTASWDGRQGDLIVVPQVRREEMTARPGGRLRNGPADSSPGLPEPDISEVRRPFRRE